MLYCRIHAIIFYLYINQPTVFLAQLSSVPLTMVWFQCLCSLSFMFDPLDHESLVNQRSSIFQVFNTSFLVSGLLLWLTSRCHYCFLFFPPFFPVLHVFSRIMSSTIFTREYIVGHQMPWPQPMKLKHMLTIQWKKLIALLHQTTILTSRTEKLNSSWTLTKLRHLYTSCSCSLWLSGTTISLSSGILKESTLSMQHSPTSPFFGKNFSPIPHHHLLLSSYLHFSCSTPFSLPHSTMYSESVSGAGGT